MEDKDKKIIEEYAKDLGEDRIREDYFCIMMELLKIEDKPEDIKGLILRVEEALPLLFEERNMRLIRQLIELLEEKKGLSEDSGVKTTFQSLFDGTPAMETPEEAEIIQLTQKLTGHTAAAVAFGTEAPYLQQLGIQTVILGPGDIDQAHQPDEYLGLDRIQPTVDLLKQLVNTICVNGNRLL